MAAFSGNTAYAGIMSSKASVLFIIGEPFTENAKTLILQEVLNGNPNILIILTVDNLIMIIVLLT